MSVAHIPLETALQDDRYRAILLERLRDGAIAAHAAESFGADLLEWCVTDTIEAIVDKVFQTKWERRVARKTLDDQISSLKYVYASAHGYLAVSEQSTEFVAFCSTSRKLEGHCAIPMSVWKYAYIDERRSVVVYDDFEHLYRKEYVQVQIDDAAFRRLKRDCMQPPARPIGRPHIYSPDIAEYAKELVGGNKKLKLYEFIELIGEKFRARAGSSNTVDEHYGDIWRASVGKRLRKPNKSKPQ